MDGLEWKTLLKWMIWVVFPYFWKHPYTVPWILWSTWIRHENEARSTEFTIAHRCGQSSNSTRSSADVFDRWMDAPKKKTAVSSDFVGSWFTFFSRIWDSNLTGMLIFFRVCMFMTSFQEICPEVVLPVLQVALQALFVATNNAFLHRCFAIKIQRIQWDWYICLYFTIISIPSRSLTARPWKVTFPIGKDRLPTIISQGRAVKLPGSNQSNAGNKNRPSHGKSVVSEMTDWSLVGENGIRKRSGFGATVGGGSGWCTEQFPNAPWDGNIYPAPFPLVHVAIFHRNHVGK